MNHDAPPTGATGSPAASPVVNPVASPVAEPVATAPAGQALAIAAESLYLANLLAAPGLGFVAIAWLRWRHRASAAPLARCHLDQAFYVSLWGGALLLSISTIFIALGGLEWEGTWVLVVMYFTCVHSALVMFGIVGLAKAMAGKPYVYPLIGHPCDD